MPWTVPFEQKHKDWLLKEVEALCAHPETANLGHVKGKCDLEVMIQVHEDDRDAFSHAVMARLQAGLKKRTGVFKPVLYLIGDRPYSTSTPGYYDL